MRYLFIILICFCITGSVFAQKGPDKVVVTRVFEKEIARTNQMIGVVDFDKLSGISSEISGLVESQKAVEGTVVKKGDILVRLNTDFIQKDIEMNRKQVEQIDIKIQNAKKNLQRYETLFKKNAASEKVYDDLSDSLRELVKQKEIAQKNIEKLELQMKKSVIHAPFSGIILEKNKNEGEWVNPGEAVCTLASIDDLVVKVAVSEELIDYIVPGRNIDLKINALGRKFQGTIRNIVPVADPATKTFQVKIAVPYFREAIRNMSAAVEVPVSRRVKLKMVKRDALVRHQGKDLVYTVKDGKAKVLPINIVGFEGEYMGVDNDYIVPGMPVVIDGNDRLRPDQPVEIIEKGA